jgi:ribosomal protein S18 acetylase RimI-like enzyme
MPQIITQYLELPSRQAFRPAFITDPDVQVIEMREPFPAFYRFLWLTIGREVEWDERESWSDEQLRAYLASPTTTVLVLYLRGAPVGFVDLNAASTEPGTEVAYLGIVFGYHRRGLGKHLLSLGVQRAFDDGASRVWLHTDNYDSPHALANYRERGFQINRTTVHEEAIGQAR